MNKEEIIAKVNEILAEKTGDKAGGSGHLSSVSISDITIDEIQEKTDRYEVKVTYTVDVLSEFDIAEEPDPDKEPDPDDPYHYKKSETLVIKK
ncbi:MAG: hypothetical protein NWF07_08860 [Candidatus Bathyarchaeota archaeon]|nr:hypothetical protein [Candidatus Bathyarchaeota archaeon]